MNKRNILILTLIIVCATILRFYRIEPFMTFLGDQGRDAITIKRLVTFEDFPAIGAPSSVGQIFLGPFYYYLVAPFLLLFNFNPAGLGIGVAFLSVLFLVYLIYVIYKQFGLFVSSLFIAFAAFSFPLVELSRFSWNPNLLPYFSFTTIFFFYKWLKERSIIYAGLTGAFLAFCMQLHYLAMLIFIPIGLVYIMAVLKEKKKTAFVKPTIAAIGAFGFFNIPLLLFDIKNNFLNSKNFIALFTESKISETDSSYISRLMETTRNFMQHAFQVEMSAQLAFAIFVLFIVMSYFVIKKLNNLFITLNVLTVIFYIFGFAFLASHRYIHYYGPAYLSFYFLFSLFPLLLRNRKLQLSLGALLIAIFVWIQFPLYYFFNSYPANQIERARLIAESFAPYIDKEPIQVVALPFTETDGHFRYFLEIQGVNLLPGDSPLISEELFVMCFNQENCRPLDDPQWQIAAFHNKQLATSWESEGVTIYKLIHGTEE